MEEKELFLTASIASGCEGLRNYSAESPVIV